MARTCSYDPSFRPPGYEGTTWDDATCSPECAAVVCSSTDDSMRKCLGWLQGKGVYDHAGVQKAYELCECTEMNI